MRIALVSPYSWSYPGGVTRHIEALAQQYLAEGHDVRVLAPHDPPDLTSKVMHRGAKPQHVVEPDYLVPLGRTIGFNANGAVSNLLIGPNGMTRLSRELALIFRKDRTLTHAAQAFLETATSGMTLAAYPPVRMARPARAAR